MSLEQALGELQELTALLRRECPWDADQTARTIVPHTVEEAYEVADAAMADDDAKLVDELGDLLYQTFFLSLLLSERGAGDLETVARGVHDKLVRRHPHVFEDADSPGSPEAVKHRWEELKTEQEGREGIFHDLPEPLPALLYARKVQRRAASTGFAFPDARRASRRPPRHARRASRGAAAGRGRRLRRRSRTRRRWRRSGTCCSASSPSRPR